MNVAIKNGQRSSSYVEYVKPYEQLRKTLTVIRYANVSEVQYLPFFLDIRVKAFSRRKMILTADSPGQ